MAVHLCLPSHSVVVWRVGSDIGARAARLGNTFCQDKLVEWEEHVMTRREEGWEGDAHRRLGEEDQEGGTVQ